MGKEEEIEGGVEGKGKGGGKRKVGGDRRREGGQL